ncbi:MAG: PspC domain-containing protein [Geodermatophilaceae bacterium]|nr:PspC domain-containing protein [Geodermatophilaceae bacterium]
MTDTDTLPPPFAPPVRPPLRRSRQTSMVGGVSGGLSEHTGIDVLLFRVGFVVVTLAGGAGLVLYAALWLLLPDPDGVPGPLRRWADGRTGNRGRDVVLLVAALIATAVVLGNWGADGGVLALAAVVLIAYLWTRDRDSRARRTSDPTASGDAQESSVPLTAASQPAFADRIRRPRSGLGAITVSTMFLALGVLSIADRNSDLAVSTAAYLGTALGIVGAGLLVATLVGRSRGLIVLGLFLLALLIPVSALQVDLRDGLGQRLWGPDSVRDLQPVYRLGGGHGQLDLSTLDFTGADAATRVSVNTGYAEILLPADVDVTVVSAVRSGEIDLFDSVRDGDHLRRTLTDDGADGPGGGSLELVVDVNLGYLEVTRVR